MAVTVIQNSSYVSKTKEKAANVFQSLNKKKKARMGLAVRVVILRFFAKMSQAVTRLPFHHVHPPKG